MPKCGLQVVLEQDVEAKRKEDEAAAQLEADGTAAREATAALALWERNLAKKRRRKQSAEMQNYKEQAVEVEKLLNQKTQLKLMKRISQTVYSDILPKAMNPIKPVGPMRLPQGLDGWKAILAGSRDELKINSPATAVYLFVVALLLRNALGTAPLRDILGPRTLRPLLDGEIDKYMKLKGLKE